MVGGFQGGHGKTANFQLTDTVRAVQKCPVHHACEGGSMVGSDSRKVPSADQSREWACGDCIMVSVPSVCHRRASVWNECVLGGSWVCGRDCHRRAKNATRHTEQRGAHGGAGERGEQGSAKEGDAHAVLSALCCLLANVPPARSGAGMADWYIERTRTSRHF